MMILGAVLLALGLTGAGALLGHRVTNLVWRPLIEELRADRESWKTVAIERQATMDRMRNDGFTLQKPAVVKESPDGEAEGLKVAEAQLIQRRDDAHFIQRAIADIVKKNPRISERDARAEAIKLRRSVTDEDSPT